MATQCLHPRLLRSDGNVGFVQLKNEETKPRVLTAASTLISAACKLGAAKQNTDILKCHEDVRCSGDTAIFL